MSWFFYILRVICYLPICLLFPVKVINGNRIKGDRVITVSNHLTALDPVIELAYLKGFRYTLAKKELGKNVFNRVFLSWLGAIFVDRGNADLAATKKVLSVLKKGYGLSIFPEGTRNKQNEELMPIKEGAAMFAIKSKTKIVPVMIYTKQRLFRKNYIYVGTPFELSEFYGKRLDATALKAASEMIEERMLATQTEMNHAIELKRSGKQLTYNKKAKKAEKNLDKALLEIK